jgi:hypothetical protein
VVPGKIFNSIGTASPKGLVYVRIVVGGSEGRERALEARVRGKG